MMGRHWLHRLGIHIHCHPAACTKAADIYNRLEYEFRVREHYNNKENTT